MNNRQVAEAFAQGKREGTGSNLFIEGNTIYSYGYHFPIAIRIQGANGIEYLWNSDKYSVTTSKHQRYVKDALGEIVLHYRTTSEKRRASN